MLQLKPTSADRHFPGLRSQVRAFLRDEISSGAMVPQCDSWVRGFDREFSRKLGQQGWLGLTWPTAYGGQARSQAERFIVVEELLAVGAPVAAHWLAERQFGPSVLAHGTEWMKRNLLPPIARGESVVAACYSEPDVGSDLASVKTRARRVEGGWRLNGSKIWSSHAHHADLLVVLCRTGDMDGGKKHDGLSMLVVSLPCEGVTVRPIRLLTGKQHFSEVIFDDALVPHDRVLGEEGAGWKVITSDLAVERSGPERFMSSFPLFMAMIARAQSQPPDSSVRVALGELISRYWALRSMSLGIAGLMQEGRSPNTEAALVKDLGTRFEGDVVEVARRIFPSRPSMDSTDTFEKLLAQAVLHSPAFTLRGGTNEILRGIVSRGLGLA